MRFWINRAATPSRRRQGCAPAAHPGADQMAAPARQWPPRAGQQADDLRDDAKRLQTPIRALDGILRPLFERWYPRLANDNPAGAGQAAATCSPHQSKWSLHLGAQFKSLPPSRRSVMYLETASRTLTSSAEPAPMTFTRLRSKRSRSQPIVAPRRHAGIRTMI